MKLRLVTLKTIYIFLVIIAGSVFGQTDVYHSVVFPYADQAGLIRSGLNYSGLGLYSDNPALLTQIVRKNIQISAVFDDHRLKTKGASPSVSEHQMSLRPSQAIVNWPFKIDVVPAVVSFGFSGFRRPFFDAAFRKLRGHVVAYPLQGEDSIYRLGISAALQFGPDFSLGLAWKRWFGSASFQDGDEACDDPLTEGQFKGSGSYHYNGNDVAAAFFYRWRSIRLAARIHFPFMVMNSDDVRLAGAVVPNQSPPVYRLNLQHEALGQIDLLLHYTFSNKFKLQYTFVRQGGQKLLRYNDQISESVKIKPASRHDIAVTYTPGFFKYSGPLMLGLGVGRYPGYDDPGGLFPVYRQLHPTSSHSIYMARMAVFPRFKKFTFFVHGKIAWSEIEFRQPLPAYS